MNKIDLPAAPTAQVGKLIEEFCPQGVQFRALGEVYKFNYGKGNTIPTVGGQYPVYGSNGVVGTHNEFNSENSPVIGHIGAYAGIVNWGHGKHYVTYNGVICKIIADFVTPKYAYYQLLKQDFNSMAHSASQPFVSYDMLNKVQIPIPPLTIQKEIVKILDNFTQLEAELEAELEARKKQYEHYREALLSFGDDVEFRALGEVCKFLRGSAITKKKTSVGEIPVVANAPGPICFHGESNRTGETIVVSRSGAYCGLVSFWNQPIFITDAFSIYLETTLLKPKFIYYFLKKNQKTIHSMKKGFGVPHVRVKDFETYSIPIPPLSKQKEIVAILDKFDALVNDISTGLPAEIAARKKQYEYYRNQLLTFKPLEAQDAN
ncbi:MAG: restriction endonuclease subunit S [Desulfobacterales bacterium]|nr:restriction endonuclease subunit S [Desulfobacterales bacterium]MDD4071421.1 restriction endonuclease subunit S [Desulfobacterales bacterium]MDD4392035.1 restriction endonuclease subunit S [Desulfobacterales bacterium]